jgi:hypothetical protein
MGVASAWIRQHGLFFNSLICRRTSMAVVND